ncbi:thiopeptide-type bacteriocin biosynthesis protein [Staphylococcus shinii]|uniref:thiopeptide-type bacteriocin biosynthesis protein n=1 Tax=Staphylococcus shinii TaxID=2912228 RepID=UPI003CFA8D2E
MEVFDYIMHRQANLYLSDLKEIEQGSLDKKEYMNKLLQFIEEKELWINIYHSSRALYNTLCYKNYEKSEKNFRNTLIALYNYLVRMICRTTPFGFHSSVGIQKVSDKEINNKGKEYYYRVNNEVLYLIINDLHKEKEITKELILTKNSNIYEDSTHFFIPFQVDYGNIKNSNDNNISIKKNDLSIYVFKLIGKLKMVRYEVLVEEIYKKYKVNKEVIRNFISQLIQEDFLITDIKLAVYQNQPIDYLLDLIEKKYGNNADSETFGLIYKIKSYKNLLECEGPNLEYLKLIDNIVKEKFPSYNLSTFKIDVKQEKNFQITTKDLSNITQVFRLFSNISSYSSSSLIEYINQFAEIYGQDEDVKLIELLNPSTGLGVPKFEGNSSTNNANTARNLLFQWMFEGIINNNDVKLDEQDIEKLCSKNRNEVHTSFDLHFNYFINNRGEKTFYVIPNTGSNRAGDIYGRFMHMFSQEFREKISSFSKIQSDIPQPHLLYAHPIPLIQNVLNTGAYIDYIDILGEKSNITLNDMYVFLGEDLKLYLRDSKSLGVLVPQIQDMHNTQLSPAVIQFIEKIINQYSTGWSDIINLGNNLPYLPRVVYKNVIISPKVWNVQLSNYKSFEEFTYLFQEFKENMQIPEDFYYVFGDSKLYINTKEEVSMYSFYKEAKKVNEMMLVETEKELDKSYSTKMTELIFSGKADYNIEMNNLGIENKKTILRENNVIINPGNDWLSINVYYNYYLYDDLIAQELLQNILDYQYRFQYIDRAYFVNYLNDSEPYLRIRIKVNKYYYSEILNYLNHLVNNNYIIKYQIVPYYQETDRYGGKFLISNAEQCFEVDSLIVATFIRNFNKEDKVLIHFAVTNILNIINLLLDDLNEKILIFESFNLNKKNKKEYRQLKNEIFESYFNSEDILKTYGMSGYRDAVYLKYKERLLSKKTFEKKQIILSIIHMFCNRLLGVDRSRELYIMEIVHRGLLDIRKRNEHMRDSIERT